MIKLYFENEMTGTVHTWEETSKYEYAHALQAMAEAQRMGLKHIETVRYDEECRKY